MLAMTRLRFPNLALLVSQEALQAYRSLAPKSLFIGQIGHQ